MLLSVVLLGCTPSSTVPNSHTQPATKQTKAEVAKVSPPVSIAKTESKIVTPPPAPTATSKTIVKPRQFTNIIKTCAGRSEVQVTSIQGSTLTLAVKNITTKTIIRIEPILEPSFQVTDDGNNRYKITNISLSNEDVVLKPGKTHKITIELDVTPPPTIKTLTVDIRSWLLVDLCDQYIQGDTYARPQLDKESTPLSFTVPLQ